MITLANLMQCERVAENSDTLTHIRLSSPLDVRKLMEGKACRAQRGEQFVFGDTSYEATCEALRVGRPPKRYADAYAVERDKWRAREVALAAAMPSRKRKRIRSEWGDEIDISRWSMGDPRCWERVQRGRIRPSVTIGILGSASVGNGETEFAETIGVAVACTRTLVGAGYAVKIEFVWSTFKPKSSQGESKWVAWSCPVKSHAEPLDEGALLALGVQGVFRGAIMRDRWVEVAGLQGRKGSMRAPDEVITSALGVDLWIGRSWSEGIHGASEEGAALHQKLEAAGMGRE